MLLHETLQPDPLLPREAVHAASAVRVESDQAHYLPASPRLLFRDLHIAMMPSEHRPPRKSPRNSIAFGRARRELAHAQPLGAPLLQCAHPPCLREALEVVLNLRHHLQALADIKPAKEPSANLPSAQSLRDALDYKRRPRARTP